MPEDIGPGCHGNPAGLRDDQARLDATVLWLEEYDRLTRQVEEMFRQATKRFAVPSDNGCRRVANVLMALRHRVEDHENPFRQSKTIRFGKLFLHHLEAERSEAEAWLALYSQGQPVPYWLRKEQKLAAQIDEARQHVEALFPLLSSKIDHRDPIREIAAVASEVWAEANDGHPPESKYPNGPLCRFVEAALAAISKRCSKAEVSEVLRGRRRKPKNGQKL